MSAVKPIRWVILLGVASFIILILGYIAEIFINMMLPGQVKTFFIMLWPHGLLLIIMLISAFGLFMQMQKDKYREV